MASLWANDNGEQWRMSAPNISVGKGRAKDRAHHATVVRKTVLIASDTAENLNHIRASLVGYDLTIIATNGGLQALETSDAQLEPSVILLDFGFGGSGLEVCRQLRKHGATAEIPVILITPPDDANARCAGFAAGAIDCISTAIESAELVARVEAQLTAQSAREYLLRRNEQLNTALASMGQGVCLFNADSRLVLCNDRYAEVYGLDPAALYVGQSLAEILRLRDEVDGCSTMSTQEYLAWADATNAGEVPQTWEKELKSGKIIRGYHQRTADGGWLSTHEDITQAWLAEKSLADARAQAERAEQETRDAHTRLLSAFDVVPEGLVLFDADDRFVMWNPRYEQLYAESGGALFKGMRFEDRLRAGLERQQYPEAIGREEEWLSERVAWHAAPKSSHEQRLPGNRWVRIDERRVADGGSIGIRVDITDLKMREASFRLLFEGNPLPMWVHDPESLRFLDVNQAAIDHYGYDRTRFLSMTLLDILSMEDHERVKAAVGGSGAEGEANSSQRHRKANGAQIDVLTYSSQLAFDNHVATMLAVVDISERKRAEEALLQHRDKLEETVRCRTAEIARQAAELERMLEQERQINQLQRQFVTMASHEFRTPLSIIDGAAQRLVRRKDAITSDFLKEKTEQIRSAVSRMLELMESILAAGRLDHGRIEILQKPCALRDIISTCSARQESIRRSHRFLFDLDRLPSAIYGDRAALEQVFTNLFSNAVKYAPNSPNIYVTGWQRDEHAYITVRDEGIGIDADDLPKMFERYFRARSSTGIAGTGIGLNLVKQVVELHCGEIRVDSVKGEGTVFTVKLPIAGSVPTSVGATQTSSQVLATQARANP
jgi:PAS domain S-box-containing protein